MAPSQRYRFEQWAPILASRGVSLEFLPFADERLARLLYRRGGVGSKTGGMIRGLAARARQLSAASRFDVVIVHREACLIGPAWFERRLASRLPLLYDFDDAVWLPNVSDTNRSFRWLKAPGKTRTLCRLASGVMAGNEYLAEYARAFNERVSIIPSTVSMASYPERPPGRVGAVPVIGWTGTHSSVRYLHMVRDALAQLRRRRRFKLLVIGVEGVDMPGIDVECRPWRAEHEATDLHELDVGLMPLEDDPWTRGKCAMKAIQYMGVGIPAVVSPVGANVALVQHGVNGLLATTTADWVRALDELLVDEERRRTLGRRARETVASGYSAETQAPRVAEIIRETAAARSAPRSGDRAPRR